MHYIHYILHTVHILHEITKVECEFAFKPEIKKVFITEINKIGI